VTQLSLRNGRLAACVPLAGSAVVARGGVGILLGTLTVLLAVDALVPIPGHTPTDADDRFRRVLRRRRLDAWRRRARHLPPSRLDVLDDVSGWPSVAERRPLGVQSVPVSEITGTVEELKARAFDGQFRPDRTCAAHWKRLWLAQAHGAELPPISVYRVGDHLVVRDGHHRVSVARDRGSTAIDADVTELVAPGR
jgi:hypothetical protein